MRIKKDLSYSLAELGKKVLTVDLDPQSNLTIGFGIIPKKAKHTTGTLITRMLTEEELPEKSEYIHSVGKVDILPASRALTVAEVNMLPPEVTNIFQSCYSPCVRIMIISLLTPIRPLVH